MAIYNKLHDKIYNYVLSVYLYSIYCHSTQYNLFDLDILHIQIQLNVIIIFYQKL